MDSLTAGFDATATPDGALRASVLDRLRRLAEAREGDLDATFDRLSRPDALWRASHPMNDHVGPAVIEGVWRPLRAAMPDLERRDAILLAGCWKGVTHVGALGHYCGTMRGDWFGIPATGRTVMLPFGEVYALDDAGRVARAHLLWDVLDVMRQAGVWPLGPPLGAPGLWPAPLTADGLRLAPSDPAEGLASLAQTLAMHRTLAEHDDRHALSREALIAMPQREHWHAKMMWYGPAGIGTTRGLDGFVDGHQLPFRRAFARPQGTFEAVTAERERHGAGHYVRLGDGPYSLTGGWPSVYAVHSGGDFCGLPPTGRPVFMRVMDFYLHHEGLIRENWVPLDMLHLLAQMGLDPLARMAAILGRRA